MKFIKNKKNLRILLTGGAGFLGKYVLRELLNIGYLKKNIYIPRSKTDDLRYRQNCQRVTKGTDIVIHLAANVGGIGKNCRLPGMMFYDNAIMGIELIEAARVNQVKKFVTVGSVCAYPKFTSIPFQEENLWNGYPDETNAAFGLAKKMLLVMGQAYRQQYNFNIIHLLPTNLYGPGDNFNPRSSHVIPALIQKTHQAKIKKIKSVKVWGTGRASREFLYVADAARAIVAATEKYDKGEPINLSGGNEISIRDLSTLICKIIGYKGKIIWDKSKPDGQPKRKVDGTRAFKEFGFKPKMQLKEGLKKMIDSYG